MKIEALRQRGIASQVIERWRAGGMRFLLPIQSESVGRFGILDGKSMVIAGPGTSGKTFCGEMAAIHNGMLGKKAIFLVPLKAIAEEKKRLFDERYAPLGIKIALATRDHMDARISRGDYDILIAIYEKFNSLTATDITLIANAGCFILDEFQLIADRHRGPELDLLVAKIRVFNPSAQMIVLMGEGTSAEKIAEWLGLPCLEESRRPVDLRVGVLHRGKFHFRGFNDLREGEESWIERIEDTPDFPVNPQLAAAVEMLVRKGEQVLIFCSTRKSCAALALYFAKRLNLPSAKDSVAGIIELPPSIQNEKLGECLAGGVAFHHAELDSEQRELVESGFRSGEIAVLVSTATLAWGVNLPAKNVFIEMTGYRGTRSSHSRAISAPLSISEFHQAAGRAGRLGSGDSFGRAVMTASTPYESEVLWERYIYSQNEPSDSTNDNRGFADPALRLTSCGAVVSVEDMVALARGFYQFETNNNDDDILAVVNSALRRLLKEGLLDITDSGMLDVTAFGRAVSSCGLSVETAVRIKTTVSEKGIEHPLEWLLLSLELREWIKSKGFYRGGRLADDEFLRRISNLSDGLIEKSEFISAKWKTGDFPGVKDQFAELLFILEWISGTPTVDLEKMFDRGGGGLKRDAETMAWISTGIERILRSLRHDWSEEDSYRFANLCSRIKFGVPDSMLPLASVLNIDREFVRRLFDLGVKSANDLFEIDHHEFCEILPPGIVERIMRKIASLPSKEESFQPIRPIPDLIRFTGVCERGSKEIVIFDKRLLLQPKLYGYLRRLWWAFVSGKPWVNKAALEPGDNQAKYISKIRKILRDSKIAVRIVSDHIGSYRLILPEGEDMPAVVGDKEHVGVDRR